jgi:hypothetical protein
MKKILIACTLLFGLIACNKSTSQKVINKWEGKWEIIGVEGSVSSNASESNPFGSIEFFEDGSGELRLKNFDYSDVDMGIVMEFYMSPEKGKTIYIQGIVVKKTNPGFENYANNLPCTEGKTSFLADRGFLNNKKTAKLKTSAWPPCVFSEADPTKELIWTVKKKK